MKKSISLQLGTAAWLLGFCFTGNVAAHNFDAHALLVKAAVATMHYETTSIFNDRKQFCPDPGELPNTQDFKDFITALETARINLPNLRTGLNRIDGESDTTEMSDVSKCYVSGGDSDYGYYPDDNLDNMSRIQIKDFRYLPGRNYKQPCKLYPIPTANLSDNSWRTLGTVLGILAGKADDYVNDTHVWFKPTNALYWGLLKDGSSLLWNAVGGIALLPFAFFYSLFSGQNIWDSANTWAHQYNPVDYATGWIPGVGDMTEFMGSNFTGLWHFYESNGWGGSYNTPQGMCYVSAGPSGEPGAIDAAIILAGVASGLSLNATPGGNGLNASRGIDKFAPRDDIPHSWVIWQSHTLGLTEFSPLDNLAQYGEDMYNSDMENGKHASAYGLGWVLHALGDASFPQHIANTTGWGHRALEDAINNQLSEVLMFDSTVSATKPNPVGYDEFRVRPVDPQVSCHSSVEILLHAYNYWSGNGAKNVRNLVGTVAAMSRTWVDTHQNVWNDGASNQFVTDEAAAVAIYKNANYDGQGMSLVNFARPLAYKSAGAILAYLVEAGQNVIPAASVDPSTKCPANTHFVHGQGCVAGPAVPQVIPTVMTRPSGLSTPGGVCFLGHDCKPGLTCGPNGLCLSDIGGQCAADAQCISGLICNSNGACAIPVGLGEGCAVDKECWSGLLCQGGICLSKAGSPCTIDTDCASGLVCNSSHVCAALSGPGGACKVDQDCVSGLVCDYDSGTDTGKCVAQSGLGGPCLIDTDCVSGLVCNPSSKTCVGLSDVGGSCSAATDCKSGLACSTSGLCYQPPVQCGGLGVGCIVDEECCAYCSVGACSGNI